MGKKPRRSWFIRDSVGNWMFARKEWGTPASEEPLRAAGKKFFFYFYFFFYFICIAPSVGVDLRRWGDDVPARRRRAAAYLPNSW